MITADKKIKNIIFDLGGVILDIDVNKSVEAFAKLGVNRLKSNDIYPDTKNYFLQLETGEITTPQFFDTILEEHSIGGKASQKELFEAWSALLLPFSKERIELIERLKERGYNLYILSNTNFPHRVRFLNNFNRQFGYDMENLFKKCYYSDLMGTRKPNKEIYSTVIKDAKIKPENTLFIDDNESNIAAAKECGLNGYHLKATQGETILDIF